MKKKIIVYNNFIVITLFILLCLVLAIILCARNRSIQVETACVEGMEIPYEYSVDNELSYTVSVDSKETLVNQTVTKTEDESEVAMENVENSVENVENSITNINITDMDSIYYNDGFNMLCYVVSHEVGNCSYESKKAVAHTILNRVNSGLFPNTVYDVLLVPGQYDAIWNSYYCGQFVPSEDTINACQEALYEYDFTLGATYYYNPDVCGYIDWFESLQICYIDDNGQRFFKEWE